MNRIPLFAVSRAPWARRTGTLLLAVSFLFIASGQALGGHHCAHHELGGATIGHQEGHGDASGHHAPHREDGGASDAEHHDPPAPCNCIGTCHGSAAAPLPPVAAISVDVGTTPATVADLRATDSRAVRRLLPHLLPFANGPPAHG